jgi:hypothetical protein
MVWFQIPVLLLIYCSILGFVAFYSYLSTFQSLPAIRLYNEEIVEISTEDKTGLAKEYETKSVMTIYIDLNFNKRSHKRFLKKTSVQEICSDIGISLCDEIERKTQMKWKSVSSLKNATQELYGYNLGEYHPGIPESHYWYWKNDEKEQEKNNREIINKTSKNWEKDSEAKAAYAIKFEDDSREKDERLKNRVLQKEAIRNYYRNLKSLKAFLKKINISAEKESGANKATDGPVTEKDGKWSFREPTPTNHGRGKIEYKQLPYLWDTKEDALNDIPLYKWYQKDHRKNAVNEPMKPSSLIKNWFVDTKPDEDWNAIRAYLLNPIAVVTAVKKIRKRSTVNYEYEKSNKKIKPAPEILLQNQEAVVNLIQEDEEVGDKMTLPSAIAFILDSFKAKPMRKPFADLSARRQGTVRSVVENIVKIIWSSIAPNQAEEQLLLCLGSIIDQNSSTDTIKNSVRQAYQIAIDKKDKETQTQIISLFVQQKDIHRAQVIEILGKDISPRRYQSAKLHASIYGVGQPFEKIVHQRNTAKKIEIIRKFVSYLMKKGKN